VASFAKKKVMATLIAIVAQWLSPFSYLASVVKKKGTTTVVPFFFCGCCYREEKGDNIVVPFFFCGYCCRKEESDNIVVTFFLRGVVEKKKATVIAIAFFLWLLLQRTKRM
jgi:hypothetical protein